jgi:DNA-binding CsgD family transcriptional regulator
MATDEVPSGDAGRGAPRPLSAEGRLAEREKELACIYSICLLAAEAPEPSAAAEGIARSLCAAMQHDAEVSCALALRHPGRGAAVSCVRGAPASGAEGAAVLDAELPAVSSGGWEGSVRLEYRRPGLAFLPQERALVESVMTVVASMLRTASLIAELRSASEVLSSKNAALREILSMIEDEKRRMLGSFRDRIAAELSPLVERALDSSLPPDRRDAYLVLLRDELGRDLRELGAGPASDPSLSPREREISVQVRNGRTSKEIAELLGISAATVERHRHNIRRKLKITNRAVNLAGLLGNEQALPGGNL